MKKVEEVGPGCQSIEGGGMTKKHTHDEVLNTLRNLLKACTRYDESPTDLNIAIYEEAKEEARQIFDGGSS